MNCPNCGSPILTGQQFCRACGVELLAERTGGIHPRLWPLIGVVMAFLGIMLALAGKFAGVEWVHYAGMFVAISGIFSIPITSLLRSLPPRKTRTAAAPQPETLPRADTTNKLLPVGDNDFVPSVVEGTTELLKTPRHKER